MLSSDPHAWLRPIYRCLREHRAFAHFAPSHQFDQLVKAAERDYPAKAATIRDWTPAAQHALLLHLASLHEHKAAGDPAELWRVTKGARELRCVAIYLPSGMRLMEGEDFRRTQLCKDAPLASEVGDNWLNALRARGWSNAAYPPSVVEAEP